MLFYYGYYKVTLFNKNIKIKKKYIATKNTIKKFIIQDYNNKNYYCDKKFWKNIKEDENYLIAGYGINCPSLQLYQSII